MRSQCLSYTYDLHQLGTNKARWQPVWYRFMWHLITVPNNNFKHDKIASK